MALQPKPCANIDSGNPFLTIGYTISPWVPPAPAGRLHLSRSPWPTPAAQVTFWGRHRKGSIMFRNKHTILVALSLLVPAPAAFGAAPDTLVKTVPGVEG